MRTSLEATSNGGWILGSLPDEPDMLGQRYAFSNSTDLLQWLVNELRVDPATLRAGFVSPSEQEQP
ncbi:hypothetical protein [Ciceribacter sp. L1K22]|uniref:hypothetical protein n=1 Tax=Ciceribacter sp. L1K22 TaxID=2820275 RepID=UPI001ABDD415|nr:hypothetical protein [Ciceribacter sp. L1K22]MBO3760390.1 hypothetical protein [Ciceribacter sp. L1K22]